MFFLTDFDRRSLMAHLFVWDEIHSLLLKVYGNKEIKQWTKYCWFWFIALKSATTGILVDLIRPLDKDDWISWIKIMKLSRGWGWGHRGVGVGFLLMAQEVAAVSKNRNKKLVKNSWKIQLIISRVNLPWFVRVRENLESPGT